MASKKVRLAGREESRGGKSIKDGREDCQDSEKSMFEERG